MQRLFLFIGLFVLSAVGIDFGFSKLFDSFYNQMRIGQTGGEINLYLARPNKTEVLIMGNSRARYQVDPDSFAVPTYSLCHAGMGQVFQTGLLEVLALKNKLPESILLHVDLEEYAKDDNLEDIGNLRYYYGKLPIITEQIDSISTFEKMKYLFRFYRYNGRVISTVKNFVQTKMVAANTGNGYQALAPIMTDTTTFNASVSAVPNKALRFHYDNLSHLQKFLSICKSKNIKVLCFTSPYFSPRDYTALALRPIDSLLRTQQIPYFNAMEHPLPVLLHHASFWLDAEHLNQLGAGYYSQQLAQWSKPLLLSHVAIPLSVDDSPEKKTEIKVNIIIAKQLNRN